MTNRKTTVFATVGLTLLAMLVLPGGVASAHGYVSAPPSRQAQCAARTVQCGPIQWEPQSVEGPKGLKSCSGGNAQFAELDDDGKGWQAAQASGSVTFTWTFTAPHRTSTFEYFVGDRKLAEFNAGNQQPQQGLRHQVSLAGLSGRQKLLAVWNIADTPNAFYSCVDLQVS